MSERILIGIGGTGAKIVESVLALCAAGMGPPALRVGFIDQDGPNGNVRRSREMLDAMDAFDKAWGQGAHVLDRTDPYGASRFMATKVSRLATAPDDFWCPHPGDARLASIFGRDQMDKGAIELMDALISKEDQQLALHKGYKGRPHIGSPAIASAAMGDKESAPPFWRAITAAIERARGSVDSRIALVGSVFGGTGASGFPTVARMLQSYLTHGDARADVKVGGVLMLPYYSFPPPGKGDDDDVVKDQDLVLQSQAALKYYARLFGDRIKLFEELYVLGWDPRYQLKFHKSGGDQQASPPLPPELIAASGVLRFLSPGYEVPQQERNKTYVISRSNRDALEWGDVPPVRKDVQDEVLLRLGQTLRFSAYWRYQLANEVRQEPSFLKPGRKGHPWFRTQRVGEVDFSQAETKTALQTLGDVTNRVLDWATLMQAASEAGDAAEFRLWDMGYMRGVYDPAKPVSVVSLKDKLDEREAISALNSMIRTEPPPPNQADLRGELTKRRPGNHRGLGPLVAAAYHGARVRATEGMEE